MKAFLINAEKQRITEVEHDDSLESIHALVGCKYFDAVVINKERDVVYIDDEGLYNAIYFFRLKGLEGYYPLAGNGLVVGTSPTGDTTPPQGITLDMLRSQVEWLDYKEALKLVREEDKRRAVIAEGNDNIIFFPAAGILEEREYTDESG